MNVVTLIGRFTKDPELTYTKNTETAICKFTIAVDKEFKRDGEQSADFLMCVAWAKTAEFISKYFYKGMKIAVRGRVESRSYETSDGERRYITEIVVEKGYFVEKKGEEKGDAYEPDTRNEPSVKAPAKKSKEIDEYDTEWSEEDLPF